jgi:hypothetical protein
MEPLRFAVKEGEGSAREGKKREKWERTCCFVNERLEDGFDARRPVTRDDIDVEVACAK